MSEGDKAMNVPKFRSTTRLVRWVSKNHQTTRIPFDRESLFLNGKETQSLRAANLANYACYVGRAKELEGILVGEHQAALSYLKAAYSREKVVCEEVLPILKGHADCLYQWGRHIGRLPKELEDSFLGAPDSPRYGFLYAKEVLRGRLPEHLEEILESSSHFAAKYAFEVIRGFSSCRLPDALHNMMLMRSFENPSDRNIAAYVEASENDPSKVGNSVAKV
jgi:hypothetical protein